MAKRRMSRKTAQRWGGRQALAQTIVRNARFTAAAAPRIQAAVRQAVARNNEKKGMDTPLTIAGPILATTNTNGDTIVLNLVQQGAGSWNRIGRKINPQSIRLRGVVNWASAAAATTGNPDGNILRMVVVWDKQPSGAAIPAFDAVFGVTAQDGTESTTFLNAVKYDNMDRFSVLRDCVMEFIPRLIADGGTQDITNTKHPFDEFISLKGREVVYSGQSNPMTIADISTGALYVYFRAAAATANTNALSLEASSFSRLRYTDP